MIVLDLVPIRSIPRSYARSAKRAVTFQGEGDKWPSANVYIYALFGQFEPPLLLKDRFHTTPPSPPPGFFAFSFIPERFARRDGMLALPLLNHGTACYWGPHAYLAFTNRVHVEPSARSAARNISLIVLIGCSFCSSLHVGSRMEKVASLLGLPPSISPCRHTRRPSGSGQLKIGNPVSWKA